MLEFLNHRTRLLEGLPNNSVVIIPSAGMKVRNNDVEYPFRQNSNFYWLSGFTESDAIMVLTKDNEGQTKEVLFSKPKNEDEEIWTGKIVGQLDAVVDYQFDGAHDISEQDKEIPKMLLGMERIYTYTQDTDFLSKVNQWQQSAKSLSIAQRREDFETGALPKVPSTRIDVDPMIKDLRMCKTQAEIDLIHTACQISAQGHIKLMQKAMPGKTEGYLQGVFDGFCRGQGAASLAYPSIVGEGTNATCLHYEKNQDLLVNGDLVLIDAGCEYEYYASDITRTFPVNGKFSQPQKQLYEVVLAAQEAGINASVPGASYWDTEKAASKELIRGLIRLGILNGDVDALFEANAHKQFYPHSIGHWVGLDVHDPMPRSDDKGWIKYEPNMVLTVEPGLYIQPNHNDDPQSKKEKNPNWVPVEPKWLGIGIRIEDVIQITADGNNNLSKDVPKQVDEIEKIMFEAQQKRNIKNPLLTMSNDALRALEEGRFEVVVDDAYTEDKKNANRHTQKM